MHVLDEGHAVLLLHGIPSSIEAFDGLRAVLSRNHRVLVPELPGYGHSPPLSGPPTFPRIRAAIEQLLGERGVTRVSVVGFSGGAYRALELALADVVPVDCLVLLAPVPWCPPEVAAQFRQLAHALRGGADLSGLLPPRMLSPAFATAHPEVVERIKGWATVAPPAVLAAELDATADMEDLRPRLNAIRVPTLIRVGGLDVAAPRPFSDEVHAAIAGSRLDVVSDAGHALLYEDSVATVGAIEAWLRTASRSRPAR